MRAGADRVANPQQLGSDRMPSFVTQPHVVDFVDIVIRDGTLEFRLEERVVPATSSLCDKSLRRCRDHRRPGCRYPRSPDRPPTAPRGSGTLGGI